MAARCEEHPSWKYSTRPMTAEIREARPSGTDGCNTHEASKVLDVFQVEILGALRAGQSKDHPSATAARCRHATPERVRSQFSETFEATHAVGTRRAVL